MRKKLTISLVVYNGADYLSACLNSVFKQSFTDWELLILDNKSTDNSLALIEKLAKDQADKVKILPAPDKNIGFSSGHNQVIKQSDGKYVLVLNQDVILEPDFCERIIDFMDKNQKVGAVTGLIRQWNFVKDDPSRQGEAEAGELTNEAKTRIIDTTGIGLKSSFQAVDLNNEEDINKEVFGASGCCPVYRQQALKEVDFFDSNFFMYKEDVDLAFRLQSAGWQAYLVSDAIAYHDRSLGTNRSRQTRNKISNYLSYRNHLYTLIKNLSLSDAWRYGIFIIWYELKKIIYLILFEQRTLYAWVEVISSLPGLMKQRRKIKPSSVKKWIK